MSMKNLIFYEIQCRQQIIEINVACSLGAADTGMGGLAKARDGSKTNSYNKQ